MQIGVRFRCYPTPEQAQTLAQWIGCQRFIYNAKVREDRYFRRFARTSLQHTGQHLPIDQRYRQFKTDQTPWLSEVPSQVLRNGAVRWKQAVSRYFSQLAGRPTLRKKHGRQSVWLTSELFAFMPILNTQTQAVVGHRLTLGTKAFPVGDLVFTAHQDYQLPASIHVSVHAGQWTVSFNYDDQRPEPTDQETCEWLRTFSEIELRSRTVGLDRGVVLPLAGSDGQRFGFSSAQQRHLRQHEQRKRRWQRRQARRTQGSRGWVQAKRRVARTQRARAAIRQDAAHQTSHALAADPRYKLYVFEALKVRNMTARAKPKQDEHGRWLKNGAAAKSGLNQAILAAAWGQTKTYLQYKARRRGKLVITVPAAYSSQECARCGHVHQGNRVSQARFVCQRCGHDENADHNAAQVLAWRGVRAVRNGIYAPPASKRCRVTRTQVPIQVGAEGSEPRTETSSTPDEITVRREGGNTFAHGSLTPETPLQPVGLSGGRLHRVVSRLNVNRKSKQNDRTRYAGLLAPFFMDTTWPREADLRINP